MGELIERLLPKSLFFFLRLDADEYPARWRLAVHYYEKVTYEIPTFSAINR